jgi:hypothetical protein
MGGGGKEGNSEVEGNSALGANILPREVKGDEFILVVH